MGTQALRASMAAYTNTASVDRNYGGSVYTTIRVGGTYHAWVHFGLPTGLVGGTPTRAVLRMTGADSLPAASRTVTIARAKGSWSEGKITHRKRPADWAGTVTKTFTAAMPAGSVWEVDIIDLLLPVTAGDRWDGLHITSSAPIRWASDEATTVKRPLLDLAWTDKPSKPAKLAPAAGRAVSVPRPTVSCDYADVPGDQIAGIQVRTFTGEAEALAQAPIGWDSGDVSVSTPTLDLATTTFPALTTGQIVWWRVRVKDATGMWSDWSQPTSWTYRPISVLDITSPTGGRITDVTPPVLWTMVGQASRQLRVLDAAGLPLYDSGRITTTDQSATVPAGVIVTDEAEYRIEVTGWDGIPRERVPGAPVSSTDTVIVTVDTDAAVSPVTGLAAAQVALAEGAMSPTVRLTWARAELPDGFTIWRDGVVVAVLDYDDALQPGGTFAWTDPGVDSVHEHTWQVQAVVNGAASTRAQVTLSASTRGVWIIDPAGIIAPIVLWEGDLQWEYGEESTWHEPYGLDRSVLVTQALRGVEGSFAGEAVDVAGYPSAAAIRARLLAVRNTKGQKVRLVLDDMAIDVRCAKINVIPKRGSVSRFSASFDLRQA